jgi:ferrochelatase
MPIWWLILHGVVLRVKPKKSAHAYASIWTERGSPLKFLTEDLTAAVRQECERRGLADVVVDHAMRYGDPSIPDQLKRLRESGVRKFIVLPLYPQYAAATTASIFDKVTEAFLGWRHIPELKFVSDYHLEPGYIGAVAASIERHWQEYGKADLLLFSLHGLPEVSRKQGDPYHDQPGRLPKNWAWRKGRGSWCSSRGLASSNG